MGRPKRINPENYTASQLKSAISNLFGKDVNPADDVFGHFAAFQQTPSGDRIDVWQVYGMLGRYLALFE